MSRRVDADAVRADLTLSPEMLRSAMGLQPEKLPRIATQTLDKSFLRDADVRDLFAR